MITRKHRQHKKNVANESATDKAFNQSFIQSCENSAMQSRQINRADANKICQCSLIDFRNKYSAEQATSIYNSGSDAEKMEFIRFSKKVGVECTKKFQAGKL